MLGSADCLHVSAAYLQTPVDSLPKVLQAEEELEGGKNSKLTSAAHIALKMVMK